MRNHTSLPPDAPQWLRDADIENPVVTIEHGFVTWHSGEWRYGEWRDGVWHSGLWRSGKWHGGVWRDGVWGGGHWHGGDWQGGHWHDGMWRDGVWRGGHWFGGQWHGGKSSPLRCKWRVEVDGDTIHIGCKSMSIAEWDAFFESDEEFETPRGTEDFRLIHRAYMAARAAVIFDRDNPPAR